MAPQASLSKPQECSLAHFLGSGARKVSLLGHVGTSGTLRCFHYRFQSYPFRHTPEPRGGWGSPAGGQGMCQGVQVAAGKWGLPHGPPGWAGGSAPCSRECWPLFTCRNEFANPRMIFVCALNKIFLGRRLLRLCPCGSFAMGEAGLQPSSATLSVE